MEHVMPRFAGNRRRLQLGHVDRTVFDRAQHTHQRTVLVIGLETERSFVGPGRKRLARRTQQQKTGVVVLDRMNIGHNDFEPEQLCGQIACDGSRIA